MHIREYDKKRIGWLLMTLLWLTMFHGLTYVYPIKAVLYSFICLGVGCFAIAWFVVACVFIGE